MNRTLLALNPAAHAGFSRACAPMHHGAWQTVTGVWGVYAAATKSAKADTAAKRTSEGAFRRTT